MPHAQRTYKFTILYTREGITRTLGTKEVVTDTDLSAYGWLCREDDYRALFDCDVLSVYMHSYEVVYAS